jgi:hypothetical protein
MQEMDMKIRIPCLLCSQDFKYSEYPAHYAHCTQGLLKCPSVCQQLYNPKAEHNCAQTLKTLLEEAEQALTCSKIEQARIQSQKQNLQH